MVQWHAARFVTNDYRQTSSVSAMLKNLNWETLEKRRTLCQLKYVHKMFSNQVGLKPVDYFESNTYMMMMMLVSLYENYERYLNILYIRKL